MEKTLEELGQSWAEEYGSGRLTGRLVESPVYMDTGEVAPGWAYVGQLTQEEFRVAFEREEREFLTFWSMGRPFWNGSSRCLVNGTHMGAAHPTRGKGGCDMLTMDGVRELDVRTRMGQGYALVDGPAYSTDVFVDAAARIGWHDSVLDTGRVRVVVDSVLREGDWVH